jgi:hypothetical protein
MCIPPILLWIILSNNNIFIGIIFNYIMLLSSELVGAIVLDRAVHGYVSKSDAVDNSLDAGLSAGPFERFYDPKTGEALYKSHESTKRK